MAVSKKRGRKVKLGMILLMLVSVAVLGMAIAFFFDASARRELQALTIGTIDFDRLQNHRNNHTEGRFGQCWKSCGIDRRDDDRKLVSKGSGNQIVTGGCNQRGNTYLQSTPEGIGRCVATGAGKLIREGSNEHRNRFVFLYRQQ